MLGLWWGGRSLSDEDWVEKMRQRMRVVVRKEARRWKVRWVLAELQRRSRRCASDAIRGWVGLLPAVRVRDLLEQHTFSVAALVLRSQQEQSLWAQWTFLSAAV